MVTAAVVVYNPSSIKRAFFICTQKNAEQYRKQLKLGQLQVLLFRFNQSIFHMISYIPRFLLAIYGKTSKLGKLSFKRNLQFPFRHERLTLLSVMHIIRHIDKNIVDSFPPLAQTARVKEFWCRATSILLIPGGNETAGQRIKSSGMEKYKEACLLHHKERQFLSSQKIVKYMFLKSVFKCGAWVYCNYKIVTPKFYITVRILYYYGLLIMFR